MNANTFKSISDIKGNRATMRNNYNNIKDMNDAISKIDRLVDRLYDKADGSRIIIKSLDRISINIELLKMNVSDMSESV